MIEVKYRMDFIDELSRIIRDFREDTLKLSRKEFAKATGIKESEIAKIETGRKCFRRELLVKLTAPFNTDVDYLLKDFDEEAVKKFLKPDTKKVSGNCSDPLANIVIDDFANVVQSRATPISIIKAENTIGNMASMDQIDFILNDILIQYINGILEGDFSDVCINKKFTNVICDRIKQIRTEKGMTQTDLAKAAGWYEEGKSNSTVWISNIEKKRVKLTLDTLLELSKALNITVEYLMYGEEVVQDV
jgi:DNA-binding helix-turn-helix protein